MDENLEDDRFNSLVSSSNEDSIGREQVPHQVTLVMASSSSPDTGGLNPQGRISLVAKRGEMSSAPSCG